MLKSDGVVVTMVGSTNMVDSMMTSMEFDGDVLMMTSMVFDGDVWMMMMRVLVRWYVPCMTLRTLGPERMVVLCGDASGHPSSTSVTMAF